MFFLQVMFVAKGKSPSNVTVNDIRISTKSCEQFPHHSVPGTNLNAHLTIIDKCYILL